MAFGGLPSFLDPYHSVIAATASEVTLAVSARQGSYFAKQMAGDFNPIHDEDSRRFCVPGDLLFALAVNRYGLRREMAFSFTGMVGDGVAVSFPAAIESRGQASNAAGKPLLEMTFSGDTQREPALCEALIREYVAFSGHNFPHILVPLLADSGVMINPDRPLVIYENMTLSFASLAFSAPRLTHAGARLALNGKRGAVNLDFIVHDGDRLVGRGTKQLAIGALLPYDQARMDLLVESFLARKAAWRPAVEEPLQVAT
ncbi:MAG: DUF3581 domain-containing protein [Bacteroidales bacterium]|nr:DUF3581 domain-containing protein [Bacteroidales bacterium]